MRCKALTLNSRRPCRAHASRSGSGYCSFHEPERPGPLKSPDGQRVGFFVRTFNLFDKALETSRVSGNDTLIRVSSDLLWIAERFLEAWIPWPEFLELSNRTGFPRPPLEAEEYLGYLRDAAAGIVLSNPALAAEKDVS